MKEAIQKAIEGGWKPNWYFSHFSGDEVVFGDHTKDSENNPCYYKDKHAILLDLLFWQCLGKALGWKRPITQYAFIDENDKTTSFTARWQNEMHRFIDHIAEGKDVDEFFNNLLTNK